ncbi:MAG TPA: choice-of-anchor V domain-containing protein [Longimicrobiales bacterium]
MQRFLKLIIIGAASAATHAATRLPFSLTGPLPAHTGGFGEPTCHACHFDYPLNEPGVAIYLDSLPEVFEPQREYRLRLRVQHAELKRGGFQLSARFEDGLPAGSFVIPDTTLLRIQRAKSVDYLSHTMKGTDELIGDTAIWSFRWVAPTDNRRVVFNLAINVSDKDASQFGDRIFTKVFYAGGEPIRK